MAVSGACKTPAIKPAIPIKVKLVSETLNPKLFIILATTFPKALPITIVGINMPPTPPAANVVVIAMALKMVIPISKPITIQMLLICASKGVFPMACK